MPTDTASDETVGVTLDAGIALALRADDSGDWKAVADWLAGHPHYAAGLADFLAVQRGLQSAVAPLRAMTERTGSRVGRYQLLAELGRGGMGVVYRARDDKLNREVAVKLLRSAEGFTPVESARFRYEAEVVASLAHPNVVEVLDFDEDESGPYLVMPLMAGGSLAAWLKGRAGGPLDAKDAATLVREVALGVHHAHQRGLIHRDLKPGNILLDVAGTPHVADFGLARRVDATASTAAGIAGTVAYMAPEQGRGEKQLTTAVDVYALGVVLFELLTGSVPYAGSEVASILLRLTDENELVPTVSQFRPDTPADLAAIVARCLEKRPEDRYTSAQELADDLAKFLADEPISSSRRGWLTDFTRALGWRRELPSMVSWWSPFCGAVSTSAALGTIQAAVLLDAPEWVGWAAMAYYLTAWLVIVRAFQKGSGWVRNPVERGSAAVQYGMALASTAIVPAQFVLEGGSVEGCFQPFCAIVGVGVFAHGIFYWGGLYAAGLLFIAFAACMPLIPTCYWPGVYGVFNVSFQLWIGVHLLHVHRHGQSKPSD